MPNFSRRTTQQTYPQVGFQYDSKVTAIADIVDVLATKPATVDASAGTSNRRVINCKDDWASVEFTFWGTNAANETSKVYIGSINQIMDYDGEFNTEQYTVTPLFLGTLTLGAKKGVASGTIDDDDFWVDTIVASSTAPHNSDYRIISPANDTKASLTLRLHGERDLAVILDLNSSTESVNFCFRPMNW